MRNQLRLRQFYLINIARPNDRKSVNEWHVHGLQLAVSTYSTTNEGKFSLNLQTGAVSRTSTYTVPLYIGVPLIGLQRLKAAPKCLPFLKEKSNNENWKDVFRVLP